MTAETETRLSPRRRVVLEALRKWDVGDGYYAYTATLAEAAGLEYRKTRVALRALVRMGYAKLSTVFDDMTGLVAGSGYAITRSGVAALEEGEPRHNA